MRQSTAPARETAADFGVRSSGPTAAALRIAMLAPPWYEVPPPGYGGIEQVCASLTDALVARGHKVTLFGVGRNGTSAEFVNTIGDPRYQNLGQGLPELLHVARANQMINQGDFDVVHDHTVAGLLSGATRRVPTVATVHGTPTGDLGGYLDCLDASVGLVAISSAQRRQRPDLPWLATIHHGLRVTEAVRSTPLSGPALWLARFAPDKGADLAIQACREAGVPLVLAGKCNEEQERRHLDEVVAPLLGPDVELVLNPDRRRCQELLRTARCLLMSIRWEEPFGLVMLEAMTVGTPVVALRRGSVPEVVLPGETGLICDDPGDLPEALRRVTALDPAACAARARSAFSPELMAARYERAYRNCAANRLEAQYDGRAPLAAEGSGLRAFP
jgi:glycosyltransferase involved in cell wall biosynthesis